LQWRKPPGCLVLDVLDRQRAGAFVGMEEGFVISGFLNSCWQIENREGLGTHWSRPSEGTFHQPAEKIIHRSISSK
jgi:hypothetical protein